MTDLPPTSDPTSLPERIFLGWDTPALPEAARILAERHAGSAGLDLRRVVVVTPGARAGRRLGELLLDQAEARRLPLTPPMTVTIGHLPELLYRPQRRLVDATTSRHLFAGALQAVDAELLKAVFPSLPGRLSGWMALAAVVQRLHRETGAEDLDFRGIGRAIRSGFPYDDSPRWEVLARVQDRYRELLERWGLGDPDRERKRALEEKRLASPGEVWLVGVVEVPRLLRRMVEALPGTVRALIHAPVEIQDRFDSLGCVRPVSWESVHLPLDEGKIRVVRRPPDQADVVVDVLHGFGGRFAAEEVVVGVPDPEVVPYLERALATVEVPHRFAGGTRLEDTGPVRLLQALAEYLDGRSYPAFAALIRHPDLHELVEGAENQVEVTGALTTVDRFQSEHLQASLEGSIPGDDKYARRIRNLVRHVERTAALSSLSGTRSISRWMPDVLEVLVRVYGNRPLDQGIRTDRQLLGSAGGIKDAASRLATLPAGLDAEVTASEAVALLLAELRGEAIPPDPEEHAVELLGWLELPLDDAPAVVLTGVNDRRIPEALGGDPFLPGALRSHLGISDDTARYARDAYLLSGLIHSREQVHLVAGRVSAGGDPLRLSRLLFAAPDQEVAMRVRRFLEDDGGTGEASGGNGLEGTGRDTEGAVGGQVPGAPSGSRFRSPPEDPILVSEPPDRIRVTDFGLLLNDPFRYALTRLLDLSPLDDDAREMDGRSFGNLAHTVLERFGRSEEAASDDAEVVDGKLGRLLKAAVRETFGQRPVPAVRVQTEQLRARLRAFARWQAEWVSDGWRVVGVEMQAGPGIPFIVDGEPILLRGKIDRIDRNADTGEWAVFDYKTGDGARTPEEVHRRGRGLNKEWVDLQLPLYRLLLAGILGDDGRPVVPEVARKRIRLGYILLPKNLEGVGAVLAEWTEADLEEAEEVARGVVRRLRTGEFRYDPGTRSFRDDPLDALLGRMELPLATEGEEGGEE
jgi:ATP-dependent helicase/nuclease subunit B